MKFVTDLHLHSKYSRAVSQNMTLANMAQWAKYKGIQVLATGDFTHPFWFEQLKKELEEVGNGLYKLRKTTNDTSASLSASERLTQKRALDVKRSALSEQKVYFLLSCEISSIYSQGGKVRRIHNLFFFPSLASVEKFNKELLKRGANLRADGRPIVGITSRDLTEIALDCDDKALVIPAHVWTPWFSVFGSFSGFDSIEECFGDMSQYVYGIETGLSSDPAMNWRIADLDGRAIISFSDAHSLEKMGREATVFGAEEISYDSIYLAIAGTSARGSVNSFPPAYAKASAGKPANGSAALPLESVNWRRSGVGTPSTVATPRIQPKIAFTIEFYPEEGKYHYTGHRDCNVSLSPQETAKNGDTCPVCRRKLTIGVMHRVEELAKSVSSVKYQVSSNGVRWVYPEGNERPPYVSMVPLAEILAECLGVAVGTKKVMDQYFALVNGLGSEFNVLLAAELSDIARFAPSKVVEAISKVRSGEVVVDPGYDGKFGVVRIWSTREGEEKKKEGEAQLNLFA